jgi:hypothetical protein
VVCASCIRTPPFGKVGGKVNSGTVETTVPATADPERGELRCPNGHDSSIPPRCPALIFVACGHYSTEATWNGFCITCGVQHEPFRIYWHSYRKDGQGLRSPKDYCGFCGAKMINGAA